LILASLSQIRAWSTEHLVDAASYWTKTADQWEHVFIRMRNQSYSIAWKGDGGDGLRQRTGADLPIVSSKADQLRQAAGIARNGASEISAAQRRVLYGVEDAHNAGFNVGEDLSVTDTRTSGTAAEQAARQAQAQAFAGDLRTRAEQLVATEHRVAGQLTATTADVGNLGFAQTPAPNRNGIQLVDFKQDGGTPAPPAPRPAPPVTGDPIKLPPIRPNPPTVINAGPPDDPSKHHCGPAEIAKDTTIAVGGAAGIASGIAGEVPTLGGASAVVIGGIGALWDGMDKLSECK
jgi:hypothetical protein